MKEKLYLENIKFDYILFVPLHKENVKLINNKNILLIDDIFTTGLTTNEISKLLKLSGANKVFVLTLLTKANDNYIME